MTFRARLDFFRHTLWIGQISTNKSSLKGSLMKKTMALFLASLVVASLTVFAQDQVQSVSPAKPKIGDEITLTYLPKSKAALHRDVSELTAEILTVRSTEAPMLLEVPMKQSGAVWKGTFKLADEGTRLLLIRYSSGEKIDDNGENVWSAFVYGKDGNPLRDSHLHRFRHATTSDSNARRTWMLAVGSWKWKRSSTPTTTALLRLFGISSVARIPPMKP